jgi:hypothetical protein
MLRPAHAGRGSSRISIVRQICNRRERTAPLAGREAFRISAGRAIFARGVGDKEMERNLSVETIKALNKIVRTCRYLRHAIGREPTPEELAGRLRMPPETIRKALGAPCTLTRH